MIALRGFARLRFAPGAFAPLACLAIGCALASPSSDYSDAAGRADGGIASSDAGPHANADAAALPPQFEGDFGAREDSADGTPLCFDGLDNDGNELFDCADRSCQANIASCCVGQVSDVCCAAADQVSLPITSCSGDLALCPAASQLITFGAPHPRIDVYALEHAFVPGGDRSDSGIAFGSVFDARREILEVDAYLRLPSSLAPIGSLDVLGVAFVDAAVDLASASEVVPLAGFVVTRNRREIHLIVADEVVARFALDADSLEGGEIGYAVSLTVSPSGQVRLSFHADGESPTEIAAHVPLDRPMRAVAYGRSLNPTSEVLPLRLTELSISNAGCEMASALERDEAPAVPSALEDPSWADGHALSDPYVLTYEETPGARVTRMAMMIDSDIYLADAIEGGFAPTSALGTPALIVPSDAWAVGGVDDPALEFDGALALYYVAYDASGRGSIARSVRDATSGRFEESIRVPGLFGADSFEGVAPFRFRDASYVVARVADAAGHHLALYPLTEVGAGSPIVLRSPSPSDLFAFDRDEVDAPSVLVHRDVVRLYFAGRRGSRWSIGERVTADLRYWRDVHEGAIYEGAGRGFDGMNVRDPAASIDANGELLELYYSGSAGGLPRIGRASQPAPL